MAEAVAVIASIPGVTTEQSNVLVHHGFFNLEMLAQAEEADLADIPELAAEAGVLLAAARKEAARRTIQLGGENGGETTSS